MKLYAFYTPSHQVLKDEWFLPTLEDDYDLQVEKYDQECQLGEYKSAGWTNSMLRKSDLIIRAITENWNDIFLYSDVDTQFFGPSSEILKNLAKRKDMIFQCDSPEGEICAGFFVCRANHRTLKLWQDIRANLK